MSPNGVRAVCRGGRLVVSSDILKVFEILIVGQRRFVSCDCQDPVRPPCLLALCGELAFAESDTLGPPGCHITRAGLGNGRGARAGRSSRSLRCCARGACTKCDSTTQTDMSSA